MKNDPKVLDDIRRRDLPEKTMRKAIVAARRIARTGEAGYESYRAIDLFCIWEETPEGEDFWASIYYAPLKD